MINERAYGYSYTDSSQAKAGRGFKHHIDAPLALDGVLYILNRK